MSHLSSFQAGSLEYYALRFSNDEEQAKLNALLLWREKLLSMVVNTPDPGSSRLKLDWWKNQALDSATQDPSVQLIQPFLTSENLTNAFLNLLTQTEKQLDGIRPETTEIYFKKFDQWGEAFALLLSGEELVTKELISLGSYIARVDHINHLHKAIQKQKLIIPIDLLKKTNTQDLFRDESKNSKNIAELVEKILKATRKEIQTILSNKKQQSALRMSLLRLVALMQVQDKALQNSTVNLLEEGVSISPIKYLWTAWRF